MPYFDHNATAPLAPCAREAWLLASDELWQNPSGPSRASARVKLKLDGARESLGQFLGTKPARLVFTSGATEGANAVFAHWASTLPSTSLIAINPTEHPCVLEAARFHFGARLLWLNLDTEGRVSVDALAAMLAGGDIGAVVVMAANNETGVLQPWTAIAATCRRARIPFACDAAQWLGKLPGSGFGGVDWLFASAHKFGGPKGVGFLQIPAQADGFHGQLGGAQERGHRGGTENWPGVAAMVAALAEAETGKVFLETDRLRRRESFERAVVAALPGAQIVGARADRLWNTVSLLLPEGENHRWVAQLDKEGFQVSTGSACATGKEGPSHVLAALGLAPEAMRRVIRISAGWETTEAEWDALAVALAKVAPRVRPGVEVVKA